MSVSAFNPAYATTNAPATNAVPTANAMPTANAAPGFAADSYTSAPAANHAPLEGLPTVNAVPAVEPPLANDTAPVANDSFVPSTNAPTANAPIANAPAMNAPTMNASNQLPAANTMPAPSAPVQAKSTGGFLGSILAAAGGGLLALKGIVPKFFPTLLQNASKLKIGGIFGIGALVGGLGFSFIKSKLSGPKDAAQGVQSQTIPPQLVAEVQAYLKQGVPPQELAKAGVPVEVLRQAGAQV
jgi:hypothetical protein